MFLSVSVRRLCGGYSQCGTSAGPPDFVLQNYRKLFNRPNYTYYYIRHFLFFLVSCGLWNTFCLFLISFSHRYTFHSACRHDISFPRHLSLPALIPLVPPSAPPTADTATSHSPRSHSLVPPSARQTAETAPSQCPCSHSLVPLLANEACFKQIRHASLSYSFQATAASSIATSAAPGLSIVTHPKGLPDSNNSRTRIQNLLDEYKSTNVPDSFIWLSIMRYP